MTARLDRKQPSPVPFLQPDRAPATGRHFETEPGRCCCGGEWPGTMTCHSCRNPNHAAEACVDGPPPSGGRYGSGRACNCAHRPAGTALAEGKP